MRTLPYHIVFCKCLNQKRTIQSQNDPNFLNEFSLWMKPVKNSKQQNRNILDFQGKKKIRSQKSTGKIFASVFWDTNSVILILYLDKTKK